MRESGLHLSVLLAGTFVVNPRFGMIVYPLPANEGDTEGGGSLPVGL
jgi:hypothetical protein